MAMEKNIDYEKLCKEIPAEINELSPELLFSHCMKTCQRLFEIAEGNTVKLAHNLPDSVIDVLAAKYEKKRSNSSKLTPANEKYSYATSIKNFSVDEEISLKDFKERLASGSKESTEGDIIKKIIRDYLYPFFGYSYSEKQLTAEEKYEIIRLIKILYNCKWDCNIDLGYLQRMSLLQTKLDIPNPYQNAILYIKERIVTRSKESGYMLPYELIMKLERYSNALRSFINTFPERSVENILCYIPSTNCKITRFVRKEIYNAVIDNLHSEKADVTHVYGPIAIQCYAYVRFSSFSITPHIMPIGSMVGDKFKDAFIELEENGYDKIERFVEEADLPDISFSEISHFIQLYTPEIQKIVYPLAKTKNEVRAAKVNITRHKEQYKILGEIYNQKHCVNKDTPICARDFVLIIYLCEQLVQSHVQIPLSSGYNRDNKRTIKLNRLLNEIDSFHNGEPTPHSLSEAEYFLATHWLWEKMFMLMTYQTSEIKTLMQRMQQMLYDYWILHIPLLQDDTPKTKMNLNRFIQKILPTERRQRILNSAESIYVKEQMENNYIVLSPLK